METYTEQRSSSTSGATHQWFHPFSVVLGFILGFVFSQGLSTILALNKPLQNLNVTNTGGTPVVVQHDAARFWNSGEMTITPGNTGHYTFNDNDTFTVFAESDDSGTAQKVVLKRSVRTAEAQVDESGTVVFRFTDE